jgi:hypothetical protein
MAVLVFTLTWKILYNISVLDHFWSIVHVRVLETPFGFVIRFYLQSHTFVTTHNYLLGCVTFTQLTRQYSTLFSRNLHNTLDIFTYSHFPCLSASENSLGELFFKNWLLRHSSSSYITLNRTSVTVAWKGCLRSVSEQRARWGLCYVTRGNAKVTWYSPTPGAVWRHRGMLSRNRIQILLRDVIASARKSCLPDGA